MSRRAAEGRDWYKDAVFYEVHVKAFADGNGDGIGDFVGLTARLDYLKDLGVDCLWVLPMYPSAPAPRRRLRHPRLPRHPPRLRDGRGFPEVPRRGARARPARHRRPRYEPHLGPAPVVPGLALRPRVAVRGLLRVERHRHALP